MRTLKNAVGLGIFILAAFLSGPISVCRAQILVGGATNQSDTPVPLSSVPGGGTFWSAQLKFPPSPFDPLPQLPVFGYGPAENQVFVIDDRDWDYPAYLAAMAAAAANQRAANAWANNGGMVAMEAVVPQPPGGNYTNSSGGLGGPSYPEPSFTTNDLYLTNFTVTQGTASLVIHSPASVSNGLYDLFYTTNLAPPISWQWVLTNAPGQTTLYVTNATNAQGFYTIGFPSAGTDFWLTYVNAAMGNQGSFTLYVSSQATATGTVSIPGWGYTIAVFSLTNGGVTNITIPPNAMIPAYDWLSLLPNGIHITSSQPVSVYGLYTYPEGRWAFTGYPTPMLGTNYCLMAHASLVPSDGCFSQFAIVATADDTTVTITPSTNANLAGYSGLSSFSITNLRQGDTYEINSSSYTDDVTGTWISSDKPIVVFAGANDAQVPDTNTLWQNPLVQELLPVAAWGNQALALSFGRPGGDSYRVLAATDGTTVTIVTTNGSVTNNLLAGEFFDTILDGWVEFQANNPIQVAQFAQGADTEPTNNYQFGDPCEILLPPTGYYLTFYTIAIPDDLDPRGLPFGTFLNLIVAQSAISTTFVDGSIVAATNFVAIGGSGYSGARVSVTTGTHTVSSSQPVEVLVYGFGYDDAYGYIGGVTSFP